MTGKTDERHILSILVDNRPGVLSRIAGLFSSRGFNIEGLCVAPTTDPLVSRVTLETAGDMAIVEQGFKRELFRQRIFRRRNLHLQPPDLVKDVKERALAEAMAIDRIRLDFRERSVGEGLNDAPLKMNAHGR